MRARTMVTAVPFVIAIAFFTGSGCSPRATAEENKASAKVGHLPTASVEVDVSEPLEYVRIYCDADGVSHFSDEVMAFSLVDYAPPAPPVSVSTVMDAESVVVISSPSGWHGDWHPAPRRQLMFVLSGELEVEVSDGEVRRFVSGAVALVEDTSGRGHVSRVVSEGRTYMAAIPLSTE